VMEILRDELVNGVWVSDEYSAVMLNKVTAAPRSEDGSKSYVLFKIVLATVILAQQPRP
jgi:hypothetical protein